MAVAVHVRLLVFSESCHRTHRSVSHRLVPSRAVGLYLYMSDYWCSPRAVPGLTPLPDTGMYRAVRHRLVPSRVVWLYLYMSDYWCSPRAVTGLTALSATGLYRAVRYGCTCTCQATGDLRVLSQDSPLCQPPACTEPCGRAVPVHVRLLVFSESCPRTHRSVSHRLVPSRAVWLYLYMSDYWCSPRAVPGLTALSATGLYRAVRYGTVHVRLLVLRELSQDSPLCQPPACTEPCGMAVPVHVRLLVFSESCPGLTALSATGLYEPCGRAVPVHVRLLVISVSCPDSPLCQPPACTEPCGMAVPVHVRLLVFSESCPDSPLCQPPACTEPCGMAVPVHVRLLVISECCPRTHRSVSHRLVPSRAVWLYLYMSDYWCSPRAVPGLTALSATGLYRAVRYGCTCTCQTTGDLRELSQDSPLCQPPACTEPCGRAVPVHVRLMVISECCPRTHRSVSHRLVPSSAVWLYLYMSDYWCSPRAVTALFTSL
ncbi:hypothetical protein J6590_066282 [Homalodisca vitripennis]|nr:hypothetical protein J6590_066282 [Homalodisca vitripennis]